MASKLVTSSGTSSSGASGMSLEKASKPRACCSIYRQQAIHIASSTFRHQQLRSQRDEPGEGLQAAGMQHSQTCGIR
jgi:hypothetical protein